MLGPLVELIHKGESQGRYGLQYDLELKILPDAENSGCQDFWMDDSEGTYLTPNIFLRSVNPMAVETMEPGQKFRLMFSPVKEKPPTCTCGTELTIKPGHGRCMCSACDAVWELAGGRWRLYVVV